MERHKRRVAMLAAILGAFMIGHAVGQTPEPFCPTEDSCIVDYHGGKYHIYPEVESK